jgi:hypothetical protein
VKKPSDLGLLNAIAIGEGETWAVSEELLASAGAR